MDIAVIGVGNVGRALAASAVRAGHAVTVAAAHPERATEVAADIGAHAADTGRAAAAGAEVVVLAVPYPALGAILAELGDTVAGKVLVDVTNPFTPDFSTLQTWATSAAEQVQAQAPSAHVVKAFNTVFAGQIAGPTADGVALDGFVAGDDPGAKAAVLALMKSLGFRPVDAGPLLHARALEAMALVLAGIQIRDNLPWRTGWKLVGPVADL